MFFVLDKPRLQRFLAIVRRGGGAGEPRTDALFIRLEAQGNEVAISTATASATLPATVYDPGVLFLRTATLSRLLLGIKGQKQLAFQVTGEALHVDNVRMPLVPADMTLFLDPTP
jgi:hypothetical protein